MYLYTDKIKESSFLISKITNSNRWSSSNLLSGCIISKALSESTAFNTLKSLLLLIPSTKSRFDQGNGNENEKNGNQPNYKYLIPKHQTNYAPSKNVTIFWNNHVLASRRRRTRIKLNWSASLYFVKPTNTFSATAHRTMKNEVQSTVRWLDSINMQVLWPHIFNYLARTYFS